MKYLTNLILFIASIIYSYHFELTTTDLVWSFWISSLVLGYSYILMKLFIQQKILFRDYFTKILEVELSNNVILRYIILPLLMVFPTIFLLSFFTIHFGFFHMGHALFLGSIFPLDIIGKIDFNFFESPERFSLIVVLVKAFFPLIIMTAINDKKLLNVFKSLFVNSHHELRKNHKEMGKLLFYPYIRVIKIHFLIFLTLALKSINIHDFWMYFIIFSFLYFPFSDFWKKG